MVIRTPWTLTEVWPPRETSGAPQFPSPGGGGGHGGSPGWQGGGGHGWGRGGPTNGNGGDSGGGSGLVVSGGTTANVIDLTENGTWDMTSVGFGTPVGAVFMGSRSATATEGSWEQARLSIGATDGVDGWSVGQWGIYSDSNTSYRRVQDNIGAVVNSNIGLSYSGTVDFDSFITDGVRVASTMTGTSLNCILFTGCNFKTGTFALPNAASKSISLGFEPTGIMLFHLGGTFNETVEMGSDATFGLASWDGSTIRQGTGRFLQRSSLGLVNNAGAVYDGGNEFAGDITDVTADGFEITTTTDRSAVQVGYVAFDGFPCFVGIFDTPTSAGTFTWSGDTGAEYQNVVAVTGGWLAVNTTYEDQNGGQINIGSIKDGSAFSYCIMDDEGNTNSFSRVVNRDGEYRHNHFDDGANLFVWDSAPSGGVTLDATLAQLAASKALAMLL